VWGSVEAADLVEIVSSSSTLLRLDTSFRDILGIKHEFSYRRKMVYDPRRHDEHYKALQAKSRVVLFDGHKKSKPT
jgi:hypothetical protein